MKLSKAELRYTIHVEMNTPEMSISKQLKEPSGETPHSIPDLVCTQESWTDDHLDVKAWGSLVTELRTDTYLPQETVVSTV